MKKVLMILGALLLGVSAFAQKGSFKKNTLSEGLGVTTTYLQRPISSK